jgi:hypothetical protein
MASPGRIVVLVLLALIAAVIAAELPELRRYMKVRKM